MSKYTEDKGFHFDWEDNFTIQTDLINDVLNIKANSAGLLSLANHLTALAHNNTPNRYHIHLDESNSLEIGSVGMIIEKCDED